MKKAILLLVAVTGIIFFAAFDKKEKSEAFATFIPSSEQRSGDSARGYQYLTTGDFIKSGFPYDFFVLYSGKSNNYLGREGKNANVEHGYNVVMNADSMDIVIPTCLQCHAQVFEGKLYMGLGNSFADFTSLGKNNGKLGALKSWRLTAPKKYSAVHDFLQSVLVVDPLIETEVRGVNSADRLAAILVAHRDPKTLAWSGTPLLDIPPTVIPTDVPAWWLLKKKNAMFYNGFGRGDFGKFLMLSNILAVSDSSEAREVNGHFGDVLAYIRSLQPPPYPLPVNKELAAEGQKIFSHTCEGCHGSYGPGGSYPNLLVSGNTIGTDSLLYTSNQQAKPFIDWFNNSWFAQAPNPAQLVPGNGYVAPPLDGVWITAPYLHNGSVPTIEAVLNSRLRPKYWSRDFDKPEYDYEHLGWKYETWGKPDGKIVYNTTLPGYGNYGHEFGDKLTNNERKAVIEYLKTL
jgi:mono/diheme cytochrome c family protein